MCNNEARTKKNDQARSICIAIEEIEIVKNKLS